MDRKLLIIAIGAFFIELALYLSDFGLLSLTSRYKSISAHKSSIGHFKSIANKVKRREVDSHFWENSSFSDQLYENDSILTLKNGAAQILLEDDIHLELHENTLVVLERSNRQESSSFHFKFSKGDLRTRNQNKTIQLQAGEWKLSASKGSDLSLRSDPSGQIQVEVKSGRIHLQNPTSGQSAELTSKEKIKISDQKLTEKVSLSSEVLWKYPTGSRFYAQSFPLRKQILWTGEADHIEILNDQGERQVIRTEPDQQSVELNFEPGSYHLTLHHQNKESETLSLYVLPAPRITYLYPLPRERIDTSIPQLFSWSSDLAGGHFKIELSLTENFETIFASFDANQSIQYLNLNHEGDFFWRVKGYDSDGFEIPAPIAYPLFTVKDPFFAPQIRAPATDESDINKSREVPNLQKKSSDFFHRPIPQLKIGHFSLLLAKILLFNFDAQCEIRSSNIKSKVVPVILNWAPVPGADFYHLEVSTEPRFEKPEVVLRTSTHFYSWTNYQKTIYFYRVAAGSHQGKKGLFTAPQKLDLTHWPPQNQTKDLADSPEMNTTTNPTPPTSDSNSTLSTETHENPESPESHPEPKNSPLQEITPTPEASSSHSQPINQKLKYLTSQIWWPLMGTSMNLEGNDNVHAQVRGLSYLGLGGQIWIQKENEIWNLQLTSQKWELKPKSQKDWPYQNSTGFDQGRMQITKSALGALNWGGFLGWGPSLKRVGIEKVGFNRTPNVGITWSKEILITNQWRWMPCLDLGVQHHSPLLRTEQSFIFLDPQNWFLRAHILGRLNLSPQPQSEIISGISLGYNFD